MTRSLLSPNDSLHHPYDVAASRPADMVSFWLCCQLKTTSNASGGARSVTGVAANGAFSRKIGRIEARSNLFLIAKSTYEIHHKVEGSPEENIQQMTGLAAKVVLLQIVLLDIVFSSDSVVTAVGMVEQIWIMVTAMVISMAVMLLSARAIGDSVELQRASVAYRYRFKKLLWRRFCLFEREFPERQ